MCDKINAIRPNWLLNAGQEGMYMAKKDAISCRETQQKIKDYIDQNMTLEEAVQFVTHVRGCEECREELEAYYAFYSALRQLDAKDDELGNFYMNIEKRLEKTEAEAATAKKEHYLRRIIYVVVALLLAAATGVSFGV